MRARVRFRYPSTWASCFANSDYLVTYSEYEQLVDAYKWSLSEIRKLTFRERKHWLDRYIYKLEQEYQKQHRQNNSTQTVIGSAMGGGVTFGGMAFR